VRDTFCICVPLLSLQLNRGHAAKDIRFGVEARAGMLAGVEQLADAREVTMGPKVCP